MSRKYSFDDGINAGSYLFESEPIIKDKILKACYDTKLETIKASTLNSDTYWANDITAVDPISRLWEEIRKLQRSTPAFVELSCKNCGAKIQQKYEDQIIKCPYCKTVYAIGIKQVNSV